MIRLDRHATDARAALRGNLLSSKALLAIGTFMAIVLLAALAAADRYIHGQVLTNAHARHELLARVLEDHAQRTIDGAALAISAVENDLAHGMAADGDEMGDAIRRTLGNLGQLRSLAIVDDHGRILAAPEPEIVGQQADLTAMRMLLPGVGQSRLGRFVAGRGLPLVGRGELTPPGVGVLPFVRGVALKGERRAYVVALLNPDSFASFQESTLSDPSRAAALVGYDGLVVASTSASSWRPGQDLSGLPPWREFLPAREQATWMGAGLLPGQRVAAFRALRAYPLLVLVDWDEQQVTAQAHDRMKHVLMAGGASIVLMLLLTVAAARAQRGHEISRRELDQAQAALAARGRELGVVFASVRDLLFQTDADGTVRLMNKRWQDATAQPVERALGRKLACLVEPDDRDRVRELFAEPDNDRPRQAEVVIAGPGGRRNRFDLTVVPLFENGRVVGFAGSGVDMTPLLAAQMQLRAQLAFSASLIENNPLPVVVLGLDNHYVRVNRAWEAFMGFTREEIIGTTAYLLHAPEHARMHGAQDETLRRTGGQIRYEAQVRRADGRLRDVLVFKSLISDAEGEAQGIVGVMMDISEIREAERATALARDAAEAVSSAKSDFIANISHELRTPLQAILGFSELGQVRARTQPNLAVLFEDVYRAGQRMLALVNDLLDLAKLDSRGADMRTTATDLRVLLGDVIDEVRPLLHAKQLRLELHLPAQPVMAMVEVQRMQQVVRNLLANAIRFSPAGAVLDVAADVQGDDPQGGAWFRVSDRGPGVPEGELEAIFDAFVQSSKTKDGAGGTGLGLAITRRIVHAHGGRVQAANREGGGAVFTVALPPMASAASPKNSRNTSMAERSADQV